jgi:hypothetical protein
MELLGEAFGPHRGLVVHPAWADDAGEQGAALTIAEGGGFDRVLPLLAGDECLAARAAGAGAADLYLGAVDA